ncbi:MAG: carboxylating nicotinate-nucleotide diphosphorylase [Pirellulaceae bacterium]|nr:carboxylating nicotinate-nucleotide diphosphorylase [Pirellulaceae bacterium]
MPMKNFEFDSEPAGRADLDLLIHQALREDLGDGVDCTTAALFPNIVHGSASFVSRNRGVCCGLFIVGHILEVAAPEIEWHPFISDGTEVKPMQALGKLIGDARAILKVERTCLNFLGRLSGIASLTSKFSQQLAGTTAQLFDTRKTTPGWRRLEKFAVRCGGGTTHRMGLYDAVLIKDNHLAMLQIELEPTENVVQEAIHRARVWISRNAHQLPRGEKTVVQIEVDDLQQLECALWAKPDIVLLDNMPPEQLCQAIVLRDKLSPEVLLEASGGVTLRNIRDVALSGVERISVGALTHSAVNFDIGLDWDISSP